jgi:2-haloacid dehalogenase
LTTRQYGTGANAARQQLEDARDVVLQLAVAALERVEVLAEGQRGRDVGAVGHQVAEDRDLAPAPQPREQPLVGDADHVEVPAQVVGVERGHREPALAAPVLPFRRERADDPDLLRDRLDLAPAPVAVRALAQQRVDRVGPGEADDLATRAHREPEHRPVAAPPPLDHQVQALRPELEGVAHGRQAARAGQLRDRGHALTVSVRVWVFFDLNGTLVDPAVLIDPPELAVVALDEANVMAMITTIAGRETAFKPLLDAALRRGLARAGHDPELAAGALERLPEMPAYPDVPGALARLRDGGHQLAVLTQSSADAAEAVLANAGIRNVFELVLSAPELGAFKPDDLAYKAALERAGVTDAWFVAGHWWDVAGAAYAGLSTAWISRTDLAYPVAMPEPDVRGGDLDAVATAILSRSER